MAMAARPEVARGISTLHFLNWPRPCRLRNGMQLLYSVWLMKRCAEDEVTEYIGWSAVCSGRSRLQYSVIWLWKTMRHTHSIRSTEYEVRSKDLGEHFSGWKWTRVSVLRSKILYTYGGAVSCRPRCCRKLLNCWPSIATPYGVLVQSTESLNSNGLR